MREIKKIDTFSANSLKVLDRSLKEFIKNNVNGLNFYKKETRAILGDKYHSLICSYLKGYDIKKMLSCLETSEFDAFNKFLKTIEDKKDNFIEKEYSFLIKENLQNIPYYLIGRFDAIYKDDEGYIIYDWKTLNLPKDAQDDLQTVTYMYALSKIFNSEKIKMRYVSIEGAKYKDVQFKDNKTYKKRIDDIVSKYLL